MDRLAPTIRPPRRRQGFQRWDELLFVHWEVPETALRPLVPPSLSLDSFEGRYFVGLVAFTMRSVKPFDQLFCIPTATNFPEINIRTYVHVAGSEPGVWFFSLDAASSLVVLAARALWHLPYFRSSVRARSQDSTHTWDSRRHWPGSSRAQFSASCTAGTALPPAKPGTLEFFFTERYQFYTERRGELLRARVHHAPYALHDVSNFTAGDELLRAAGLPTDGPLTPTYFSPGVDVDVFPLEPVERQTHPRSAR